MSFVPPPMMSSSPPPLDDTGEDDDENESPPYDIPEMPPNGYLEGDLDGEDDDDADHYGMGQEDYDLTGKQRLTSFITNLTLLSIVYCSGTCSVCL